MFGGGVWELSPACLRTQDRPHQSLLALALIRPGHVNLQQPPRPRRLPHPLRSYQWRSWCFLKLVVGRFTVAQSLAALDALLLTAFVESLAALAFQNRANRPVRLRRHEFLHRTAQLLCPQLLFTLAPSRLCLKIAIGRLFGSVQRPACLIVWRFAVLAARRGGLGYGQDLSSSPLARSRPQGRIKLRSWRCSVPLIAAARVRVRADVDVVVVVLILVNYLNRTAIVAPNNHVHVAVFVDLAINVDS